ncbi:MAG: hypothetical protein IJA38_07645 [Bacteroidales bacterium]|nr:hypothetical protein [Bacteroidales bacterium]MBQ5802753.1 hypothetical protein [Bacteroidales bacterium]MBQ7998395.1 hypothetical protein [Bacteroidales bacterium]MBR4095247.1 hypothetical protein [Bacteroidales bacterium]
MIWKRFGEKSAEAGGSRDEQYLSVSLPFTIAYYVAILLALAIIISLVKQ